MTVGLSFSHVTKAHSQEIADCGYPLRESVRICLSILKRNRWLSIVFQHWNVRYFAAILEEAAEAGAELRAAVTQIGDTIWSMHKKNKERVLAGEMILSFYNAQAAPKLRRPTPGILSFEALLSETLREISPDQRPFAGEALFNQMILRAWNKGTLDSLDVSREDFAKALTTKGWHYNPIRHQWFHNLERAPVGFQLTF